MSKNPALLGLERKPLRMQAADALRRAITTGELPAGAHVPEIEMAGRLGISRGTLREAIRILQLEGLLTEGSRGRLLVRRMSAQELADLFRVRTVLESLAARTLAESDEREAAVSLLREAVARMAEATGRPLEDRMRTDLDFHREMCRLTGNATLIQAWNSLEGLMELSITNAGIERAVRNMNADRHLEIVDAIATGDPDVAAAALDDHMALTVEVLNA